MLASKTNTRMGWIYCENQAERIRWVNSSLTERMEDSVECCGVCIIRFPSSFRGYCTFFPISPNVPIIFLLVIRLPWFNAIKFFWIVHFIRSTNRNSTLNFVGNAIRSILEMAEMGFKYKKDAEKCESKHHDWINCERDFSAFWRWSKEAFSFRIMYEYWYKVLFLLLVD